MHRTQLKTADNEGEEMEKKEGQKVGGRAAVSAQWLQDTVDGVMVVGNSHEHKLREVASEGQLRFGRVPHVWRHRRMNLLEKGSKTLLQFFQKRQMLVQNICR